MMRHLGMQDINSGSKNDITPEEKWVDKNFQSYWTDMSQFVSVDDLDTDTSCAMESPPDAHSDDDSSEEEHEW
jgi:hypothetical protein